MSTPNLTADLIGDIAKANQDTYLAAYQTGYDQGYMAGMRKSLEIIEKAAATPVKKPV